MKKELGITDALKPIPWWTNAERRFKWKIGYESVVGRLIGNGLPPRPKMNVYANSMKSWIALWNSAITMAMVPRTRSTCSESCEPHSSTFV